MFVAYMQNIMFRGLLIGSDIPHTTWSCNINENCLYKVLMYECKPQFLHYLNEIF